MHLQSNELASYINDLDDLQTKTYLFEVVNSLFNGDLQAIDEFKSRFVDSVKLKKLKEDHNSNLVFPEF